MFFGLLEPKWKKYKKAVLKLAVLRNDPSFCEYVEGVSDKMWQHVYECERLPEKISESKLFEHYCEDKRFFDD